MSAPFTHAHADPFGIEPDFIKRSVIGGIAAYVAHEIGVPDAWSLDQETYGFWAAAGVAALAAGGGLVKRSYIGAREAWKFAQTFKGAGARGRARWGTLKDARAAGLVNASGAQIIGALDHELLSLGPETSTLIEGPAGLGKTSAYLLPKLFTDPRNHLSLDVKGELQEITAAWRAQRFGHRIVRVKADGSGDRINALSTLWRLVRAEDPAALIYAARVSNQLLPEPEGSKGGENAFFRQGGRDDFETVMLALAATAAAHNTHMCAVFELFRDETKLLGLLDRAGTVETLSGQVAIQANALASAVRSSGSERKLYEQFRAGVLQATKLFGAGGMLAEVSQEQTFEPRDLRTEKGVTVYIETSPNLSAELGPWIGLCVEQMLFEAIEIPKGEAIEVIAEEFTNNPVRSLGTVVTLLRSYRIRCTFTYQNPAEVRRVYDEAMLETLRSEGALTLYLGARGESEKYIAERLGQGERRTRSWSYREDGTLSPSLTHDAGDIASAEEVRRLDPGQAIALVGAERPFKVGKVSWWEVREWARYARRQGLRIPRVQPRFRMTRRGRLLSLQGRASLDFGPLGRALAVMVYGVRKSRLIPPVASAAAVVACLEVFGAPHVLIDSRSCAYVGPTALHSQHFGWDDCPIIRFEKTWP